MAVVWQLSSSKSGVVEWCRYSGMGLRMVMVIRMLRSYKCVIGGVEE